MKPFFCYYGGKWRSAGHYPEPRHEMIVEPFAGAAGYSTRFGANRRVVLADKDPLLARLWQWLISAGPEDIRALPLIGAGVDVRTLSVHEDAQNLIAFWLNKGTSRPRRTASKWMLSGIRPRSFWGVEVRERIAEQMSEIKTWRAVEASYVDLPDVEATWFIDPPYAGRPGSHYAYGSGQIDYAHLAEWCRTRRGQVIVCEARGADWLPFASLGTFKSNHRARRRGGRSAEVVWTND